MDQRAKEEQDEQEPELLMSLCDLSRSTLDGHQHEWRLTENPWVAKMHNSAHRT